MAFILRRAIRRPPRQAQRNHSLIRLARLPCARTTNQVPAETAAAFGLFIAASLIPIFANKPASAVGPFAPAAELLNGRAAMLGFAILLTLEAINNAPLF